MELNLSLAQLQPQLVFIIHGARKKKVISHMMPLVLDLLVTLSSAVTVVCVVSSSSSIAPTSGYSSYGILDQDSNDDLQSCPDSHQTKNRASKEAMSHSRS